METNLSKLDQVVHVLVGLAILSFAFYGPQTPWGYLGLGPIFMGVLGFDPIYHLLGVSTCPGAPVTAYERWLRGKERKRR